METKIVEAVNKIGGGYGNWGKFLVGKFTDEWGRRRAIPGAPDLAMPLLTQVGWTQDHFLVLDLQTGEGAVFRHGGLAEADLHKHRVWVCPLFEPFLAWLYGQDVSDLQALPDHVVLPGAPFEMRGYRRPGPPEEPTPRG